MKSTLEDEPLLKLDQNERSEDIPNWVKPFFNRLDEGVFWRYPQKDKAESAWANHLGLQKDQVMLTNGSDEAISLLFAALQPGTQVILPLPAFGVFIDQCSLMPVQAMVLPPASDLAIDQIAIQRALEQVQNGVFILTRPNNPTGECIPRQLLQDWIRLASSNKTRVLLDEAYADFSGETSISFLNEFPNLLIMRTLSKAYGLAGFRIGMLLGDANVLKPIRRRAMPFNLSSPAVELAIEAISSSVQKEVEVYCSKIRKNRQYLFELLTDWGLSVFPGHGNFLLIRSGSPRNTLIANFLKSRGIAVRLFGRPELSETLRISIPANLDRLIPALKQVIKPDLVCLDVDGCLMDVSRSFDEAIIKTVFHFTGGQPTHAEIASLRAQSGFNSDFSLSAELIQRRGYGATMKEVIAVFESCYWGDTLHPGTVQNEIPLASKETMEFLGKRFDTAIITGRNQKELETMFCHRQFSEISFSVTMDDVKKGKPDPEGIHQAQTHFKTQSSWMVGDNVDDILAAVASHSVPVGIGRHNKDQLVQAGACIVLNHIDEIRSLLS